MDGPRKESIGEIRLKKFEERFSLLGNIHASECPSTKEEKDVRESSRMSTYLPWNCWH